MVPAPRRKHRGAFSRGTIQGAWLIALSGLASPLTMREVKLLKMPVTMTVIPRAKAALQNLVGKGGFSYQRRQPCQDSDQKTKP